MLKKRLAAVLAVVLLLLSSASALAGYEPLLAVGGSFVYARDNQGVLRVWGDNQYGQLGKGSNKQSKNPAVFKTKNADIDVTEIKGIYAGCDYSYFLMNNGDIYGVGNNLNGAMTCKKGYCSTHVKIALDDKTVTVIAPGFGHTLALNEAGEVYAWGRNNAGQVGNGKTAAVYEPVKLELPRITAIAAGGKFSIALDENGVLWGWGDNTNHELSAENVKLYKTPVPIDTDGLAIQMIDAGGSYISCVDANGVLYMWGINAENQCGFDSNGKDVLSPTAVDLPLPVGYLASYSSQTYVILSDGSLWGWGNNTYGQLGLGFRTASGKGVTVSKIWDSDVVMVQGGSLCMTAMLRDGRLMTAGINKFGQLGLATKEYEIASIFENGMDLIVEDGAGGV